MSDPILFAKHLTQIRGPRDNTTVDLQGVLETSGIFAYLFITNIKSCIWWITAGIIVPISDGEPSIC